MEARIWKRAAFACRYGNQRLEDVLDLGFEQLRAFNGALDEIIREENAPAKSTGKGQSKRR